MGHGNPFLWYGANLYMLDNRAIIPELEECPPDILFWKGYKPIYISIYFYNMSLNQHGTHIVYSAATIKFKSQCVTMVVLSD